MPACKANSTETGLSPCAFQWPLINGLPSVDKQLTEEQSPYIGSLILALYTSAKSAALKAALFESVNPAACATVMPKGVGIWAKLGA